MNGWSSATAPKISLGSDPRAGRRRHDDEFRGASRSCCATSRALHFCVRKGSRHRWLRFRLRGSRWRFFAPRAWLPGLDGVLTKAVMRDLGDLAPGFQVIAGSTGPGHGFVYVVDFDGPEPVFGLKVHFGDFVHADRHGAVVVPPELFPTLGEAILKTQAGKRSSSSRRASRASISRNLRPHRPRL
jgi:hypothetical protein